MGSLSTSTGPGSTLVEELSPIENGYGVVCYKSEGVFSRGLAIHECAPRRPAILAYSEKKPDELRSMLQGGLPSRSRRGC
jgi:hypothetical protein